MKHVAIGEMWACVYVIVFLTSLTSRTLIDMCIVWGTVAFFIEYWKILKILDYAIRGTLYLKFIFSFQVRVLRPQSLLL